MVRRGFNQLVKNAKAYRKNASIMGVQVQQMLKGGQEVMIGAVTDPSFGKMIAFGLGGVLVEVMKDITFRLAPVGKKTQYRCSTPSVRRRFSAACAAQKASTARRWQISSQKLQNW